MKVTNASKCTSTYVCFETNYSTTMMLDFPRTADGRVYHLGVRFGEVANRIVRSILLVPPGHRVSEDITQLQDNCRLSNSSRRHLNYVRRVLRIRPKLREYL